MKNKNNVFVVLFSILLFVLILSFSCQPPAVKNSASSSNNLPVKTILWQDDGTGFIQYYTNDVNNCSMGFFINTGNVFNPMQSVEIQVKKISGSPYYGYGIIFCAQDSNNFYRILIAANGYFNIYKKVSGTYTMIIDWTYSSNLNQGYNVINDFKVTSNGSGTFTLYFNGNLIGSATDTTFSGGDCGYYVGVGSSSDESFPNTPVDVRFKYIEIPFSYKNQWGSYGTGNGQFINPIGIAVDITENVYVLDYNLIQKFDSSGNYISQWGSSENNMQGYNMAIDNSGNVYVSDDPLINKFDSNGNFIKYFLYGQMQIQHPSAIEVTNSGNAFVLDLGDDNPIKYINTNGDYLLSFGSEGSGIGQIAINPFTQVFATDCSGNLYVADNGNNRIQVFVKNPSLNSSISQSSSLSKISLSLGNGSSNKWNGFDGIKDNASVKANKKK